MNTTKTLVIIAGAAGEIGTEYCKKLVADNITTIGVVRNKNILGVNSPLFQTVRCNLDNQQEINNVFEGIVFDTYDQVIYLHTIGVDKFDPRNYPNIRTMTTIDPDIYNTNVNSFKYLMRFCVQKIRSLNSTRTKKIQLKISIIAGVADKHTPFVIESFCEAKYILRQYIQSQVNLYPEWVSGLSINITSTITKSALHVRPHADTKYWLTPEEVANQSLSDLLSPEKDYREIDIIKELPDFIEGYYENNHLLYEKWSRETGIY